MFGLKNKFLILLILICLLGFFTRFYKLAEYPIHLSHDEITQLYDAISIAQTGQDIYKNFLPTIFVSIEDFKPPFYTYITALTYFITGFNEITIRIPGALFGSLIVPAMFWFVYKLFKNYQISLLAAFLTAIAPFEIHFSRKSFENGAGIFLMLIGFSALLTYLEKKHRKFLYLGIVSLAFSMYTYFSHATVLPILLFMFIIIFRQSFLPFKRLIMPFLTFIILAIPLFLIIFFNPTSQNRSKAVFITQDPILQSELNNAEVGNSLRDSLFRNNQIVEYSFTRYLNQLDPKYLFSTGLGFTNQEPIDMGMLYFWQLPFILLGLVYLIRIQNKTREKLFILAWILIGLVPSGLTFEEHSPHRIIMVFTMFNIFTALGIYFFYNIRQSFKKFSFFLIALFLLVNILYFLHVYSVNWAYEKSETMHYPFKQVSLFAWENRDNYDQIIFDPNFGKSMPSVGAGAHYYLAFYGKYPPAKMQEEYRLGLKPREVLFDKFSIRRITWLEDSKLKNVLVIASPLTLPESIKSEVKILKEFTFYDGTTAFYAIGL